MRLIIPRKQELIDSFIQQGRCYYLPENFGRDPFGNEETETTPLFELFQRLTTVVLISPVYDRHSKSHELLHEMLSDAINFEGVLIDYEVLNAISYIPPQNSNDESSYVGEEMTMAFVLMLMVENYINPNRPREQKTFLTACREVGLELKKGADFNSGNLQDLLLQALDELKLDSDFIKTAVKNWHEDGSFEIGGVKYTKDSDNDKAVYLTIVRKLKTEGSKKLLLNSLISLVVGMEKYLGRINESDLTKRREESVKFFSQIVDNKELRERVLAEGEEARNARMQSVVTGSEVKPKLISQAGAAFFKDLFLGLPDETLRIYKARKYRFAYTEDRDLSRLYPAEVLPGFTEAECQATRTSKGANLSRFNLMMIAKGIIPEVTDEERDLSARNDNKLLEGKERELVFAQQTMLHESLHLAFNKLTLQDDFPDLFSQAIDLKIKAVGVFNELQNCDSPLLEQQSLYLNGRCVSIKEVLNLSSSYYKRYMSAEMGDDNDKKNAVVEEALANLYGLAHSLYSEKNKPNFNPFLPSNNHPEQIKDLVSLLGELNKLVSLISFRLDNIQVQFPEQQLPAHPCG